MPRPPPPADRLDQHRPADLAAERHDLVERTDRSGRARHQRQAELLGGLLGDDLVAHHADVLRRRADEGEAVRLDRFGEAGVLGQEAVAGMDGVDAGDGRGRQDGRDVEIAVARRRRADADRFVGQPHMHGVAVGGRMHRHGLDAHLAAGAMDAERDLAAVGDQDLVEHRAERPYSTIISGFAELHRLGVVDQDLRDRAGLGRLDRVEGLHRLDDQQRLARRHLVADRDELGLPGSGAR